MGFFSKFYAYIVVAVVSACLSRFVIKFGDQRPLIETVDKSYSTISNLA